MEFVLPVDQLTHYGTFESWQQDYTIVACSREALTAFLRDQSHNFLKGSGGEVFDLFRVPGAERPSIAEMRAHAEAMQATSPGHAYLLQSGNVFEGAEAGHLDMPTYHPGGFHGNHRLGLLTALGEQTVPVIVSRDHPLREAFTAAAGYELSRDAQEAVFEKSTAYHAEEIDQVQRNNARAQGAALERRRQFYGKQPGLQPSYLNDTRASSGADARVIRVFNDGVVEADRQRFDAPAYVLNSEYAGAFLGRTGNPRFEVYDVNAPSEGRAFTYDPDSATPALKHILGKDRGILVGAGSADAVWDSIRRADQKSEVSGKIIRKVNERMQAFIDQEVENWLYGALEDPYQFKPKDLATLKAALEIGSVQDVAGIATGNHKPSVNWKPYIANWPDGTIVRVSKGSSVGLRSLDGDDVAAIKSQIDTAITKKIQQYVSEELLSDLGIVLYTPASVGKESAHSAARLTGGSAIAALADKGLNGYIQKVFGNDVSAFRKTFGLHDAEAFPYELASYGGSFKALIEEGYKGQVGAYLSEVPLQTLVAHTGQTVPEVVRSLGYNPEDVASVRQLVDRAYRGDWQRFARSAYGSENLAVFVSDFQFATADLLDISRTTLPGLAKGSEKRAFIEALWGEDGAQSLLAAARLNHPYGLDGTMELLGIESASLPVLVDTLFKGELEPFLRAYNAELSTPQGLKLAVDASGGVGAYLRTFGLDGHMAHYPSTAEGMAALRGAGAKTPSELLSALLIEDAMAIAHKAPYRGDAAQALTDLFPGGVGELVRLEPRHLIATLTALGKDEEGRRQFDAVFALNGADRERNIDAILVAATARFDPANAKEAREAARVCDLIGSLWGEEVAESRRARYTPAIERMERETAFAGQVTLFARHIRDLTLEVQYPTSVWQAPTAQLAGGGKIAKDQDLTGVGLEERSVIVATTGSNSLSFVQQRLESLGIPATAMTRDGEPRNLLAIPAQALAEKDIALIAAAAAQANSGRRAAYEAELAASGNPLKAASVAFREADGSLNLQEAFYLHDDDVFGYASVFLKKVTPEHWAQIDGAEHPGLVDALLNQQRDLNTQLADMGLAYNKSDETADHSASLRALARASGRDAAGVQEAYFSPELNWHGHPRLGSRYEAAAKFGLQLPRDAADIHAIWNTVEGQLAAKTGYQPAGGLIGYYLAQTQDPTYREIAHAPFRDTIAQSGGLEAFLNAYAREEYRTPAAFLALLEAREIDVPNVLFGGDLAAYAAEVGVETALKRLAPDEASRPGRVGELVTALGADSAQDFAARHYNGNAKAALAAFGIGDVTDAATFEAALPFYADASALLADYPAALDVLIRDSGLALPEGVLETLGNAHLAAVIAARLDHDVTALPDTVPAERLQAVIAEGHLPLSALAEGRDLEARLKVAGRLGYDPAGFPEAYLALIGQENVPAVIAACEPGAACRLINAAPEDRREAYIDAYAAKGDGGLSISKIDGLALWAAQNHTVDPAPYLAAVLRYASEDPKRFYDRYSAVLDAFDGHPSADTGALEALRAQERERRERPDPLTVMMEYCHDRDIPPPPVIWVGEEEEAYVTQLVNARPPLQYPQLYRNLHAQLIYAAEQRGEPELLQTEPWQRLTGIVNNLERAAQLNQNIATIETGLLALETTLSRLGSEPVAVAADRYPGLHGARPGNVHEAWQAVRNSGATDTSGAPARLTLEVNRLLQLSPKVEFDAGNMVLEFAGEHKAEIAERYRQLAGAGQSAGLLGADAVTMKETGIGPWKKVRLEISQAGQRDIVNAAYALNAWEGMEQLTRDALGLATRVHDDLGWLHAYSTNRMTHRDGSLTVGVQSPDPQRLIRTLTNYGVEATHYKDDLITIAVTPKNANALQAMHGTLNKLHDLQQQRDAVPVKELVNIIDTASQLPKELVPAAALANLRRKAVQLNPRLEQTSIAL